MRFGGTVWRPIRGALCFNNKKALHMNKKTLLQYWGAFSKKMGNVVQHKHFETFIIFVILLSSVALVSRFFENYERIVR